MATWTVGHPCATGDYCEHFKNLREPLDIEHYKWDFVLFLEPTSCKFDGNARPISYISRGKRGIILNASKSLAQSRLMTSQTARDKSSLKIRTVKDSLYTWLGFRYLP